MPRARKAGGNRQGAARTAYSNRTDLNGPAIANRPPTYGDGAQAQRSMQVVPLPQERRLPPAPPPPVPGAVPFDRETERPNEPLTAGMNMGAGPGPSVAMPSFDPTLEALRAAMLVAPSPGIAALIESRQAAVGLGR